MKKILLLLPALLLIISLDVLAAPYWGTVFVDPDIIVASDPSKFVQVIPKGSGSRIMFDRRTATFETFNALLFNAEYSDGDTIEIQVNPEFDTADAETKANFYGHVIGQMPLLLRSEVKTVWIHMGNEVFGGGNQNILIHTDAPGYHGEWLEETIFHESCHTSLDASVASSSIWLAAQSADDEFISTYARDNPDREDVAESCLLYFAVRYRVDRIDTITLETINSTIPNRIAVLDALDLSPVADSDSGDGAVSAAVSVMPVTIGELPVADAGVDITIQSASSSVKLKLDGSGSTDEEDGGSLSTYSWYEGNKKIAAGISPVVTLSNGNLHEIALRVQDSDGNDDYDRIGVNLIKVDELSVPEVPQQSLSKIIRTDGTATDASFSIGASSDGGESFDTAFTVGDEIIITAKIYPASDDSGIEGELYVVMRSTIDGKKVFTALNQNGNWEAWNASLKSLPAARYVESLEALEEVLVYSGTITAGDRLFYVGYSPFTEEGKPVITTSQSPFKITVSE